MIQAWVRAKTAGGVVRARFGGFRLRWVAATLLWLTPAGAAEEPAGPGIVFEEVLPQASGIRWVHENAMSAQRHLPETVGPGCAIFDYDNDGWMDLYLVNSGISDFYTPAAPLRNALYRNDRDGTFTDVTEAAGVSGGRFGMGVAVADYDGDGWQDLYVTNYGPNDLYRNNGDGSFSEVAKDAGLLAPGWSTSGVWFDYDGDGRLDLFVCSFVRYDQSLSRLCFDHLRKRTYYCLPTLFDPTPSHLFRNDGNGRFTDVSRESGIAGHPGKAFGVVATDVNNDGHLDLFVANDTVADFLFVNQGNGTFREMGLWAGVAFDDGGKPRSGMGVDATDYDGDGLQDLFVSNIDHEVFSLYRNQGDLTFTDEAADVGKLTWLLSGWGLRFFDADNDGDEDLFLANGHPDDMVEKFRPGTGIQGTPPLLRKRQRPLPQPEPPIGRRLLSHFLRPGTGHRGPGQRRRSGPAHHRQRRTAGAAPEPGRQPQPLAWPRSGVSPRPHPCRRRHHLVGGRGRAPALEACGRQLSLLQRSPGDPGPGLHRRARLGRDSMAKRRQDQADRPPTEPLPQDHRVALGGGTFLSPRWSGGSKTPTPISSKL